jgi:hypothetical protein
VQQASSAHSPHHQTQIKVAKQQNQSEEKKVHARKFEKVFWQQEHALRTGL